MTEATTLTNNLSGAEYNDFLRILTNLKEICNDIDIRGGFVRQRSNDKSSVFEIDLNPILPGVNIAISDIKRKLDLLKTFTGQDVTLEIFNGDPGYFIFSDRFSSLKFISPFLDYIDNKYIESEELERIFVMNEDDLILEYDLTSLITERIRVTTANFSTNAIQVVFEGETAAIRASTQAKDQFAKFVSDIPTNIVMDNCSALLSTIPFSVDHDTEVKFRMIKAANQDISLNSFETNLGDINMKIYSRSAIVADEE